MTSAASTANAAVPAPGKLEFKDDYTPKEAERVIRNSKGLPVGVKPKMVWTWPKALLWAVIAIVCAIGWAILAVSRGEQPPPKISSPGARRKARSPPAPS